MVAASGLSRTSGGFSAWLLVAALLGSRALSAQSPPGDPFARIAHLGCSFTTSAAVTWTNGPPRVDVQPGGPFQFQLDSIDALGGTAFFVYGASRTSIVARLVGSTLHFLDRRLDGSMAMTTVFAAPQTRGAPKYPAAYSRTEFYAYNGPGFVSMPQAAQYYGSCEPGPR